MTRLALILALFLGAAGLPAPPAAAGAWPRERGSGFASATLRLSRPMDDLIFGDTAQYSTLYLEYGLGRRWTAGFDIGRSVNGGNKTVGYLRRSLPAIGNGHRLALELGAGEINGNRVLRPALSYGKGLAGLGRRNAISGWYSVDTVAEIDIDSGRTDFKIDVTFGLNRPSGRKWIIQLQSGAPHDRDEFLRLAPSVVIPMRGRRHVEMGMTYGLWGDKHVGVMVGLWQEF